MNRCKIWLLERFLPTWCRQELTDENRQLRARVEAQRQEIQQLEAYIAGIRMALRTCKKITIQTGGGGIEPVVRNDREHKAGEY